MSDLNPSDPDDPRSKETSSLLKSPEPDPTPGLRRTYTWENGQIVEKWVPVKPKQEYRSYFKINDFSGDDAIYNGLTGELQGSLKDMAITRQMGFTELKAEGDISLGSLFPSLAGSEWDVVTFKNASFIHRPPTIVERLPAGLWLEADVEFQGRLKPIADALVDLFRRDVATVHLSAYFGYGKTTTDELVSDGFKLRGSIRDLAQDFGPLVQFIDVGIEIGVLDSAHGDLDFRFGGELLLNVDHSVMPLVVSYGLEVVDDMCIMEMAIGKGQQWMDVLGVVGLNLSGVKFTAKFPKTDIRGNLALKIEAGWSFKGLTFELEGQLRKGDSYITCSMPHCTLQNVYDIFNEITGRELESVQHDLEFSEIEILIGQGCIKLHGKITMNGYSSVAGTVLINQDGVSISGELNDIPLFSNFVLTKAALDLVVGKSIPSAPAVTPVVKSGRRVAGVITGEVTFYDSTFKVGLVVQKTSGKALAWMAYGELSTNLSIADLVTDFPRDSEFNVTLRRVAVIASSGDDIHIPELNVCGYPVQKGIQICATLDGMPLVNTMTHTTDTGTLILRAAYSTEMGLTVGIALPLSMNISPGQNMKCGPLTLEFATKPSPLLRFKAELELLADKNSIPLKFEFGVDASATSFDAYGRMDGYWVNPFGISKRIKIGTPTSFRVGISPTATPSALGLQSRIHLDEKKEYSVGLQITQNPMETLVTAYMAQLSVDDLIDFVNAILDVESRVKPPDSALLRFEDVNLCVSAGTTINKTVYPPGFSFKGTMYVCDKKASLDCSVTTEGLRIKGRVQGFQLGPIVVKGATGDDAIVDVVINKDEQHFNINGLIAIPALQFLAKVTIVAQMQPTPDFTFNFDLSWSELLKITVKAQLIKTGGAIDFNKMENVDFELEGIFQSDILNQLVIQLRDFFKKMHEANKHKIDDLRSDVKDAKAKTDAIIADAKLQLERARKAYDSQLKDAENMLLDKQHAVDEEKKVLGKKVAEAEATATGIVRAAESTLENEKLTAHAHVRQAKQVLNEEIEAAERAERGALRSLQDARIALQGVFGDAIGGVERAERAVENGSGNIRATENRLHQCQLEYDRMGMFECAGKWIEILDLKSEIFILERSRDLQLAALDIAKRVLQGTEYIVANCAVASLEASFHVLSAGYAATVRGLGEGLNLAEQGYDAIIEAGKVVIGIAKANAMKVVELAMGVLRLALEVGAAALKVLADVVDEVKKGTEFLIFENAQTILDRAQKDTTLVDLAIGALDIVEAGEDAVYSLAQQGIEHICKTINIEFVKVNGNLSCFVRDGGQMNIKVRGWVGGKRINFGGQWDPMDTKGFLLKLCDDVWRTFLAGMADGVIFLVD